jgi:putative SOS response-associated peptidase YedK
MCGRYASTRSREDLLETFKVEEALADEEKAPDYNVAPTKTSPTVLARPPRGANEDTVPVRQLRNLKWGLVPSWAKDPKIGNRMINARAETVHEKPAFRRAFKSRRLLIPVDGFYEWFPTQ